MIGPLDWGPVIGGYLASLFLAAAYIAIGLYVSSRSENQIVSLIVTVVLCSCLYLLGSDTLTTFFGTREAEVLKLFGTGARFESITRGVIDFRDLYYYLTVVGVFLSLNVFRLEKTRWGANPVTKRHRFHQLFTGLVIANCVAVNFRLAPISALRIDLTEGNIYSISNATRGYLQQLKEPLLIRGYFSAQTHPLLAPLVPRIQDLLREYAVAGGPQVNIEFVDPLEYPELEEEAGRKYGIRPIPFQTTTKYQASVTNSYFDILVQYGDQFETLSFRDLIEVKVLGDTDLAVELRNPEYDITRAIKKTLYSYQGGGDILTDIGRKIEFTGYISPQQNLPEALVDLEKNLRTLLDELKEKGGELFSYKIVDPDGGNGEVAARLQEEYGFRPMAAGLFDQRPFWFYMVLHSDGQRVEIPLPEELGYDGVKRSFTAALKRFASGFTRNIAIVTQPTTPPMPQYGIGPRGKQFNAVKEMLQQEHGVIETDLASGSVPEQADLLLLLSPEKLNESQLFAVDQFLMRGGTVIIATSPYDIETSRELALVEYESGLEEWLSFHGIEIAKKLVMDSRNTAFPVPVQRDIGGFTIQETRMLDYPFFVDIRQDGMSSESGILRGIEQITMNWSSPIELNDELNKQRQVRRILASSAESWLTGATDIQPDFDTFPQYGFSKGDSVGSQLLGVAVQGEFMSFFHDRPSPLLQQEGESREDPAEASSIEPDEGEGSRPAITGVIDRSSDSAQIICFSSNTFLADSILNLGAGVRRTGYLEPVQMIANAVDRSLEDSALLDIRGRSHFSRPLYPLEREDRIVFEYVNYFLAVFGLFIVWLARFFLYRKKAVEEYVLLQQLRGGNDS
jgi:ABC-2 type transport system permease protein